MSKEKFQWVGSDMYWKKPMFSDFSFNSPFVKVTFVTPLKLSMEQKFPGGSVQIMGDL